MSSNSKVLAKGANNNFNDRVYTPNDIVKDILEWVKPNGTILEPFKGDGAFYDELVKTGNIVDWTEIDLGRDFFEVDKHYDYIITNPPYSIFTQVLEHSFKIADNVIMLIPHNKIFTSDKRLDMIEKFGTFTYKRFKVPKEWTAKFPIGAYWFKKHKINDNCLRMQTKKGSIDVFECIHNTWYGKEDWNDHLEWVSEVVHNETFA